MRIELNALAGMLKPGTEQPQVALRRSALKNGREIAERNEFKTLLAVNSFGHLRIAEIARFVWPQSKYSEQMARRTVKRLESEGLLVARRNAVGGQSYVLSRRGAGWLELRGHEARHGLDLSSIGGGTFLHRTISTRYLIEQWVAGYQVAGEYASQQNRLPFSLTHYMRKHRKLPDGLVWRETRSGAILLEIIETENAAKPTEEICRVLQAAELVGRILDPGKNVQLIGLTIVFDAMLNHAERVRRASDILWSGLEPARRAQLESVIRLVFVELKPPLVWASFRHESLREYKMRIIK
jgi:hypothetical protein